ncbi:MAG: trypsin-like peptidase domain-containing protein [Myxococcales bacterium]|nr:trypsin-like peptidase domain-containing protein [Myxococcota bacterium]MDW8280419.1 trypsin-like peptidase domain-containing protein [Myxococcales bacterium]
MTLPAAAGSSPVGEKTLFPSLGRRLPPALPLTQQTFVRLASRIGPAVVHITVLHRMPEKETRRPSREQGTGFIIHPSGYIVTNNHVVDNAQEIRVRLQNERDFTGHLVGGDARTDIALLKIDPGPTALAWAPVGDSDTLQIGEWVVAIGNPFGLDHTVTAGIVSAKGRRDVQPGGQSGFFDFIQTDASINPGNSGGPLINTRGEVIGINTAINVAGSGIGFAIPINIVKVIVQRLHKHGRVRRSWLGVYPQPITEGLRRAFGLPDRRGALIAEVVSGSPAEEAGIQAGDVILAFDGRPLHRADDLTWLASITEPRKVTLQVFRHGQKHSVEATLVEAAEEEPPPPPRPPERPSALGITVSELTPQLARQLGYTGREGLIVMQVDPGSPAMDAGVEQGDVILQVNDRPVHRLAEYAETMHQVQAGQMIRLLVRREERKVWRNLWVAFPKR